MYFYTTTSLILFHLVIYFHVCTYIIRKLWFMGWLIFISYGLKYDIYDNKSFENKSSISPVSSDSSHSQRKSREMKALLHFLALLQLSSGCKKGQDGNLHIEIKVGKMDLFIFLIINILTQCHDIISILVVRWRGYD